MQKAREAPAEDPVTEDDDPIASFAPTETDTLDDKVAVHVPTMPEDMVR